MMASFKPKRLICCSNLAGFTLFYGITAMMTSTCSTYMSSQLTTLEKYFGFSSYQSGFLLSCNDIGFLTTTLIVSHFARKIHIPRVLSMSTMSFGVAAIICSIAYFGSISEKNRPTFLIKSLSADTLSLNTSLSNISMFNGQSQQLCDGNRTGTGNLTNACADEVSTETGRIGAPNRFTKAAFAIIAVGLILQGISKSPRSPLMTTYIDDNGTKTKTALYVGIISCMGILGPAVAFGLGGLFTRIYVTLEDVPISPYHPRWIGAWWIGFLLFGCLAIIVSLPLFCFPRRLRPPVVLKHKKRKFDFKAFIKDLYQLIRNPLYMLMIICGCIDIFAVSAFISFTPKYLETQFALPVWLANILMGMLGILSAGIGTLVGGVIVSKFKFSPLTCLKCVLVTNSVFALTNCTLFFLGCSNPRIVNYNNNQMDTNSSCAAQCHCDVMDYFPLCGSDGRNYFSPCQAGCIGKEELIYTNCACVGGNATATPGLCPSDCNKGNIYGFLAMSFIGSFVACVGIMPGFIFVIRSVHDRQKPLALGLGSFLHSILGWLPAPMIFGSIVDSCCKVWSSRCKDQGACAKYDIEDFRIKRSTFEILCNVTVICIQCVVFFLSRRKRDWSTGEKSNDVDLHDIDGPTGNRRNNFERAPFIDRIYKGQINN